MARSREPLSFHLPKRHLGVRAASVHTHVVAVVVQCVRRFSFVRIFPRFVMYVAISGTCGSLQLPRLLYSDLRMVDVVKEESQMLCQSDGIRKTPNCS